MANNEEIEEWLTPIEEWEKKVDEINREARRLIGEYLLKAAKKED